jgi:hypothetical protein
MSGGAKVGDLEYRFGYYLVGRIGKANGRWVWGQFSPMIPQEDLAQLLHKARAEGTLLDRIGVRDQIKTLTLRSVIGESPVPIAVYRLGDDAVVTVEVLDEDGRFLAEEPMQVGVQEWDPEDIDKRTVAFPKDGERFLKALLNQTGMSYYDWKVD